MSAASSSSWRSPSAPWCWWGCWCTCPGWCAGPPLERLVADLRRLDRLRRGPQQATRVRRLALLAAYDDVLLDVCRAVGVENPPLRAHVETGGTQGALDADREFRGQHCRAAWLRTEAAIETTGVRIDPPGHAA